MIMAYSMSFSVKGFMGLVHLDDGISLLTCDTHDYQYGEVSVDIIMSSTMFKGIKK
jgi:hypothetical protein